MKKIKRFLYGISGINVGHTDTFSFWVLPCFYLVYSDCTVIQGAGFGLPNSQMIVDACTWDLDVDHLEPVVDTVTDHRCTSLGLLTARHVQS